MIKFYAVYSRKALGVLSSWSRVEDARENGLRLSCKIFDTFSAAEKYAIRKYNYRAKDNYSGALPFNHVVRKHNMDKLKQLNSKPGDKIFVLIDDGGLPQYSML